MCCTYSAVRRAENAFEITWIAFLHKWIRAMTRPSLSQLRLSAEAPAAQGGIFRADLERLTKLLRCRQAGAASSRNRH